MTRLFACLLIVLCTQCGTAADNFSLIISCPTGQQLTVQLKTAADEGIGGVRVSQKNNQYIISGALTDWYTHCWLIIENGEKTLIAESIWIQRGEMNMQLTPDSANTDKWLISRSNLPFRSEEAAYKQYTQPVIDSLILLSRNLTMSRGSGSSKSATEEILSNQRRLRKELIRRKVEFVKVNYQSYYSLYIFRKEIMGDIGATIYLEAFDLVDLYALIPEKQQRTNAGMLLKKELDKILSLQLGQKAPDFIVKTLTEDTFRLSDFRDSLVLICFWDSYCAPCIASFPALRFIDSSYSGKGFKMISVSIDRDKKKWKGALDLYKLPWPQACDVPEYQIEDNMIRAKYRVMAIPQYFLVDKSGNLIYHNDLSKDDANYSKLKKKIAENL